MDANTRAPSAAPEAKSGSILREGLQTLWSPARLAEKVNQQRVEAGKLPAPEAAKAAVKKGIENFRSTTVIYPDGTQGKLIIHSPAERMKTYYIGLKMAALVLGILFAGSIFRFIGEQMAGNSGAIAEGFVGYYLRKLGL